MTWSSVALENFVDIFSDIVQIPHTQPMVMLALTKIIQLHLSK